MTAMNRLKFGAFLLMKNNPKPYQYCRGKVIRANGAKPKPHEYITAEALADVGYIVRFIPSKINIGMADCYINNTIFEMKAPEGRTVDCIERNLRKATNHQSSNIIIDSFRIKNIQDRSIQNYLIKKLSLQYGIRRIIFVNRKREVIDINSFLR